MDLDMERLSSQRKHQAQILDMTSDFSNEPAAAARRSSSSKMKRIKQQQQRRDRRDEPLLFARQQASASSAASSSSSRFVVTAPSTSRAHPISGAAASSSRSASAAAASTTSNPQVKTGPGLLKVYLPADGFVQCGEATLPLTVADGTAVHVSVVDYHDAAQNLQVDLPPPVTSWLWTPIDFPAGSFLRLEITASPNDTSSPNYASYTRQDIVRRGHNDTSCLTPDDLDGTSTSNGGSNGDFSGRHHSASQVGHNTIAAVAGVLGGVLFILVALIVYLSVRRRREHNAMGRSTTRRRWGSAGTASDSRNSFDDSGQSGAGSVSGDSAAQRARLSGWTGYGRAFLTTPRRIGAAASGRGGRRGSPNEMREVRRGADEGEEEEGERAGLGYMSSLVPNLDARGYVAEPGGLRGSNDLLRSSADRERAATADNGGGTRSTAIAREEKDKNLPSYKQSQKEAKKLPSYSPRPGNVIQSTPPRQPLGPAA